MATNVSFGSLVDPEQQAIERRRAMAQALMQQGTAAPQQQTAGGMTVATSPLENIAKVVQMLRAKNINTETDASQKSYVDRKKTEGASEMQAFVDALRGKPAQSYPYPQGLTNDDEGNPLPAAESAATAPNPEQALMLAMKSQSGNPMLQAAGGSLLTSMLPKAAKMERVEVPDGKGGKRVGFVNMNAPNPMSTFQEGGNEPVKGVPVNGVITNPYELGKTVPKQVDAPRNPNLAADLLIPGPGGAMVPNVPLIDARKAIQKAGASNVGVSVNTAMKPLLGEIGKGAGEQINNDFAGARAAQGVLQNVAQIKSGLGNAILGPMANQRVTLAQIGQSLGVNGKDATEQLQNTRNILQGLARQEMVAAAGMKGQGQITESERAILRKAESGQINEMTKPEVETLLNALTKTANYRIGVHQENLQRLSKEPAAAEIVKFMQLPGVAGSGSVLDQADAILRGGR